MIQTGFAGRRKPEATRRRSVTRRTPILAAVTLMLAILFAGVASAQKAGGVLRVYHRDSPASMSIHEEGTVGVIMPMMGVMNNLIVYDQHIPRNEPSTIRPELATSWAFSADGMSLTFQLRDG